MSYLSSVCAVDGCIEAKSSMRKVLCETHRKQGRTETCARYDKAHREERRARLKTWRTTTVQGFLCFVYSNMRNRVNGITQHPNGHYWAGKELLAKDTFYVWARKDENFIRLFATWQQTGHAPQDPNMPSINRLNNEGGYTIGNMEWVPFTENCSETGRWE